ncbi:hypothetical protein [Albimonas pacifica]|uniref:Uncharacterized protein n=1 Tax=Albimonas pacifica TaxID=1114924 RepID=A0A1I3C2I0_9RHOB|nr:hypothetical protein [Albimonas pacifica]SFH68526.1 hypothetical protein SAMN05216258_101510 [Albimonas pacifica]
MALGENKGGDAPAGKGRGKGRGAKAGGPKGRKGGQGGKGGAGGARPALAAALKQARLAALAFRRTTGRPLGAAESIGALEAVRALGLTLARRNAGHDATDASGRRLKLQVRGAKGDVKGPLRLGPDKAEWDAMALVMLDGRYRLRAVFEADRAAVKAAAGDKPRLPAAEFRKVAKKVWDGEAPEE